VTDGAGGPLAVVVAAANVNDDQLLQQTLDAMIVARPRRGQRRSQHLSLDKGYDTPTGRRVPARRHYIPHLRRKGEAPIPKAKRKHPARRWVVERSFAWVARFRRLARDYERLAQTLVGLHYVAFVCLMLHRAMPFLTVSS